VSFSFFLGDTPHIVRHEGLDYLASWWPQDWGYVCDLALPLDEDDNEDDVPVG
jgi:hypothetical protein